MGLGQGWPTYWPAGQYFKPPKNNTEKIVDHGITTQKFNENAKKNEKIELCGVARAFVQISENGPRSKKFGHP